MSATQERNGQHAIATKPTASLSESRMIEYVPFGESSEPIKLSMGIVRDFVANKTKSGKSPTDAQLMKFMMLCKSRRLNPFEGDAFLVGYDSNDGPTFSLITAHQAFMKRAEISKEFDGMESGVIVIDGQGNLRDREGDFHLDHEVLVGAWAVVHFKTRKHPMRDRISIKAFRKPFGLWKTDPAGMIVKCCESSVLRKSFPTMLGGLYLEDEMPANRAEPPKRTQSLVEKISSTNGKYVADPVVEEIEPQESEQPAEPEKKAEPANAMADAATVAAIRQEIIDLGLDDRAMRTKHGVKKWEELTMDMACDVLKSLRGVPDEE